MAKKALLMILDGWGEGPNGHSNAIYSTPTPYLDFLKAAYPHSTLKVRTLVCPTDRWATARWAT